MTRILLTAFEPYVPWKSNASWLALVELTRDLPKLAEITTRLYPVKLGEMKDKLAVDLKANYDFAFHLGQAPGSSGIQLEEIAVNVVTNCGATESPVPARYVGNVCESGPPAYRTPLPAQRYAETLRRHGIPACVSYHAGTFLCNAIFYWSCRLGADLDLPTRSMFIHVPLETSQVLDLDQPTSSMPSSMVAEALRLIIHVAANESDSVDSQGFA